MADAAQVVSRMSDEQILAIAASLPDDGPQAFFAQFGAADPDDG